VWAKALVYCRLAGEKALARSAYREAEGYFAQALGALPHLPEQRTTREQAIDLRLALRNALRLLGDDRRLLAVLREAEALAGALDDPPRLGQVLRFLANQFSMLGAHDQAIATSQRALALASAGGDAVLHAQANDALGAAYLIQGDYRRGIDCYRQTVAFFDGTQRYERFGQVMSPAVSSRARLAWAHAELGTFAAGTAIGEEGLRIADVVAHRASLIYALWGMGALFLRQGHLPRAVPLLERAVDLCQDVALPAWSPMMAAALGVAYTLSGRVAAAGQLLTQAMEQTVGMEAGWYLTLCRLSLAEAYGLASRQEEAQACAEQVLALGRAHQERGNEAYALRLLGDIAALREPPERNQAEAHYRQALALAEELGMRPLQAHCHRGLGALYAVTGQREQARVELSTAVEMYRGMEMTFWLPQTEATLAQVEER
jgi:tetratricopeptide (TPR) repeat protein